IQYNGAGAIGISRTQMKKWLSATISDLIRSEYGEADLSIALVVSAVGATGSGSLEQLIDIVIEAAQYAGTPLPVYCNVFIMQPGIHEVTDLGLANTLALYAEMAASRLSKNIPTYYWG